MYDVLQCCTQNRFPHLALSFIDLAKLKEDVHKLQLPPLQSNYSINDSIETISPQEEGLVYNCPELPAELQPELHPVHQDSDIPNNKKLTWGKSDNLIDYDAFDLKNTTDFDSTQDLEAFFYDDDVIDAWIQADEECIQGAKPRLYERLNISYETKSDISSKDDNPSVAPLSILVPYLFIHQIPYQNMLRVGTKGDAEFIEMYQRHAYLTSHDHDLRVSCFKQNHSSNLRWLLVQEFTNLHVDNVASCKKEADYWWWKNGWVGVMLEVFSAQGE